MKRCGSNDDVGSNCSAEGRHRPGLTTVTMYKRGLCWYIRQCLLYIYIYNTYLEFTACQMVDWSISGAVTFPHLKHLLSPTPSLHAIVVAYYWWLWRAEKKKKKKSRNKNNTVKLMDVFTSFSEMPLTPCLYVQFPIDHTQARTQSHNGTFICIQTWYTYFHLSWQQTWHKTQLALTHKHFSNRGQTHWHQ